MLDDPYRQNNPDSKPLVLLTNGSIATAAAAFSAYDSYAVRREIENGVFRETKQAWFLERPPQNTLGGFRAHVYLTFLGMALTTAFRGWLETQDKRALQGIPPPPVSARTGSYVEYPGAWYQR